MSELLPAGDTELDGQDEEMLRVQWKLARHSVHTASPKAPAEATAYQPLLHLHPTPVTKYPLGWHLQSVDAVEPAREK